MAAVPTDIRYAIRTLRRNVGFDPANKGGSALPIVFALLLLIARASLAQTVEHQLAYTVAASADQRLDLYRPTNPDYATVLFVHGGSLSASAERRSSAVYANVCPALATRGIGCATMDYRLSPPNQWPAMPNDVAAAVRWLHDNLAGRGGDPKRIIVFGHSSGCLLATLVGTDPKYLATQGLDLSDLAGVIAMGCTMAPGDTGGSGVTPEHLAAAFAEDVHDRTVYGTLSQKLDANPSMHIGPSGPPILLLVAEAERFAPPILEQGARFVRRLRQLHRPADLRILNGREHMTSTTRMLDEDDPVAAIIVAFVHNPAAYVATP